jgi:hypothetical protein
MGVRMRGYEMGYTLDYLPDKDIISVKIKGRLNFQVAEKYSKAASKLAHKNECTKILIDHTETTLEQGIYKIHTSGDELQQFGFNNTDFIAIVVANEAIDCNLQDSVSKNSHWSVIKYFYADQLKEAYDWLLEIETDL